MNWLKERWEGLKHWDARLTFVLGAILGLPLLYLITGRITGISPKEYALCLAGLQADEKIRETIATHSKGFNERAVNFENYSSKNNDELSKVLLTDLSGQDQESAIRLSSNNQDAIRALLELSKAYTSAIAVNAIKEENSELLTDMYEAVLEVFKAQDPVTNDVTRAKFVKVYNDLLDIYGRSVKLPEPLKSDFRIEVYRYLSFVAAKLSRLEDKEGNKRESTRYGNESSSYTDDAWNLREALKKRRTTEVEHDEIEYRQKYFWIDFSRFVSFIKYGDNQGADRAFESMKDGLRTANIKHLELKLIQHKGLIEPKYRERWDGYIKKVYL